MIKGRASWRARPLPPPLHPLRALLLALLAPCPAAQLLDASNWPSLYGPSGDGQSPERGWSSVGAELPLWRAEVGLGYSSPAVVEGALLILGHDEEAQLDQLFAFDALDGTERWTRSWPAANEVTLHTGGTLSSPTVLAGRVYVASRAGVLRCFALADGAPLWSRELALELGLDPPQHGFSASPLALGDGLLLGLGGLIVHLDAQDGAPRWQSAQHAEGAYGTPIVFEHGGETLVAALLSEGLYVLDAADGSERGFFAFAHSGNGVSAASPLVVDDQLFISAGYRMGARMLRLGADGLEPVWGTRAMNNKMDRCVAVGAHLYGFDESMLKCLDLDGNELWRRRGLGMGSLSASDGRLLVLSSKGELIVASASPDGYEELARAPLLDDGTYWTPPVLSHGLVYCRNSLGSLVCLDHRGVEDPTDAEPGTAAVAELPDARTLFQRHLDAIGGEERVRKQPALILVGRYEAQGQGIVSQPMRLLLLPDGHYQLEVRLSAKQQYLRRYDGEHAWESAPEGREGLYTRVWREGASALVRPYGSLGDELLHLREGWLLTTRASEDFEGRACYRVEVRSPDGAREDYWFSAASGLLVARASESAARLRFDDWQPFEGRAFPRRIQGMRLDDGTEEHLVVNGLTHVRPPVELAQPPQAVEWLMRSALERGLIESAARARYAPWLGTWRMPEGTGAAGKLEVRLERGRLGFALGDGPLHELVPTPLPDRLGIDALDNCSLSLLRDRQGRPGLLRLDRGEPQRFRRRGARDERAPMLPITSALEGQLAGALDAASAGAASAPRVLVSRAGEALLRVEHGAPDALWLAGPTPHLDVLAKDWGGSMLTAVGLILAQRGLFDLDETLATLLELETDWARAIDLRQLLTRRSGLAPLPPNLQRSRLSVAALRIALVRQAALHQPPGTARVHGADMRVLEVLIEEVTQRPWQRACQQLLFGPLGLECLQLARATTSRAELPLERILLERQGLVCAASDATRWLDALATGELVSASVAAQVLAAGEAPVGWLPSELAGQRVLALWGEHGGGSLAWVRAPARELEVCVLWDDPAAARELALELSAALLADD